jgi:hypothetical protein
VQELNVIYQYWCVTQTDSKACRELLRYKFIIKVKVTGQVQHIAYKRMDLLEEAQPRFLARQSRHYLSNTLANKIRPICDRYTSF